MNTFEGKGVLVTGAGSGIGKATAQRLLADGATVVGIDLEPDAPEELIGDEFTYQAADVLDAAAVSAAVAAVVAAAGRLDGVVHAAGVAGGGPVHMLPDEEWDRVVGVNLKGTFVVARAALSQMVQQDRIDGERGAIWPIWPASRVSRARPAEVPTTRRRGVSCCSPRTLPSITDPAASGSTSSARVSSKHPCSTR
jgi:NAD(P)-dependent dehydrogenase (short-subunit alcohol dehydrogenase family)